MPYLDLEFRFLQPLCHARGEDGSPEWPPSPLRAFQAVVAAAAGRWNERERLETAAPALRWLERRPSPTIVAPRGRPSTSPYRLYVPDNATDKVAASWSRGGDADIADHRTEKDVRPTRLAGDELHVLYPIDDAFDEHRETLFAAARSVTHLGWGTDVVVANARVVSDEVAAALKGERWRPVNGRPTIALRSPRAGAVEALTRRHTAFLRRITQDDSGRDSFAPVPPLSAAAFEAVGYRTEHDPEPRPFAAFALRTTDGRRTRAFDAVRRSVAVAGMLRHAARMAAERGGWRPATIARFVLGHGEQRGEAHQPVDGPRLAFVPVPSLEWRGRGNRVGDVRRVLLTVFGGTGRTELDRIERLLTAAELVLDRYTRPATTWATVTPMILPGYDDPRHLRRRLDRGGIDAEERKRLLERLSGRVDGLIRKAIRQTGFPDQLAEHALVEWRSTGFWPGTEPAARYRIPRRQLRFPRYHVRITWRDETGRPIRVGGPLCLGGGRFHGCGLFAGLD